MLPRKVFYSVLESVQNQHKAQVIGWLLHGQLSCAASRIHVGGNVTLACGSLVDGRVALVQSGKDLACRHVCM